MKKENIFKSISLAIAYLEDSIEIFVQDNEKKAASFAWRAASDLEYALFLFSLIHQDETERSSWKPNSKSKQVEIKTLLISARDLLKEAKKSFEEDEFHDAHKKTWIARGLLLRVHDLLEKKLRKDKKVLS